MDPVAVQSLRQLFEESTGGADAVALAGDMLLFASGGLNRYVATRGPLLATDELAAAQTWLGRPLRLLEVAPPDSAGSVTAVDLGSGERLPIAGPFDPTTIAPGDAILTRALPVGDAWLLTAALLRIPPAGREAALALLAGGEVRPFQLLELQIDLQVEAMKASR